MKMSMMMMMMVIDNNHNKHNLNDDDYDHDNDDDLCLIEIGNYWQLTSGVRTNANTNKLQQTSDC